MYDVFSLPNLLKKIGIDYGELSVEGGKAVNESESSGSGANLQKTRSHLSHVAIIHEHTQSIGYNLSHRL